MHMQNSCGGVMCKLKANKVHNMPAVSSPCGACAPHTGLQAMAYKERNSRQELRKGHHGRVQAKCRLSLVLLLGFKSAASA